MLEEKAGGAKELGVVCCMLEFDMVGLFHMSFVRLVLRHPQVNCYQAGLMARSQAYRAMYHNGSWTSILFMPGCDKKKSGYKVSNLYVTLNCILLLISVIYYSVINVKLPEQILSVFITCTSCRLKKHVNSA